ncbi:MAG: Lrp/AsnC family transcriptional regulator [Anaerolineaceae bacterium]|nr:Lrp/AsnC family transcriptional regulator [Anaerolineae bacterium]MDX9831395.1 Lrp/AsnC family transcriptional regulator [Anaerolineae bacterium]NLF12330.1 Lrp/AsnC family transcriptional regulator [Anaerolineaceae bacterium]
MRDVKKEQESAATYHLDEIDERIVQALKEDGRMSFAEIARRLDVSPGMIRQRYFDLVENRVVQVVAVTNPTLVGYDSVALIGVRVDGSRLREIAREIAAFKEVIYLVLCAGSFDILVEVVCRDNAHLLRFLSENLRALEGVRATETFVYLEIVKETYL